MELLIGVNLRAENYSNSGKTVGGGRAKTAAAANIWINGPCKLCQVHQKGSLRRKLAHGQRKWPRSLHLVVVLARASPTRNTGQPTYRAISAQPQQTAPSYLWASDHQTHTSNERCRRPLPPPFIISGSRGLKLASHVLPHVYLKTSI